MMSGDEQELLQLIKQLSNEVRAFREETRNASDKATDSAERSRMAEEKVRELEKKFELLDVAKEVESPLHTLVKNMDERRKKRVGPRTKVRAPK